MSKKEIPEYQIRRIEEISQFIRNWHINERLSQREFAFMADIHVNTLHNFLTKKKNVSLLTLINCIDATGLTISQFFEGVE
jgi:transcriptional regulator with XRE-family HTH domain